MMLILLVVSIIRCNGDSDYMDKILRTEEMFGNVTFLSADLLHKLDPGHCYTLITDPLYQDVLQPKLFQEIGRSTYFVVKICFNEDMLSPNNRIQTTLLEARKAGCRCYLIYLANGIQMERFMRFIDRQRAIDTQVKLIVLHDYRLFVTRMHYIWKRFINVIFVREYEQHFRNSNSTMSRASFELSTVPYPFPIKQVFVTKNLEYWRDGKYRHGAKFNFDKTSDLAGQEVIICVLKHTPGVYSMTFADNETVYSGLEFEIVQTISQSFNFTAEFYESDDAASEQWGVKTENGSWTGLIGEMVNGAADIALGDLYYIPYHLQIMDLSIPYTSQCLTFLTPEALSDNSWQTLILPFSDEMWAGVLFFLFCVGSVFYILEHLNIWIQKDEVPPQEKKLAKIATFRAPMNENVFFSSKFIFKKRRVKRPRDIFHGFSDCILYTYSMLLVVSLPRLPQKWPIRMLTGWYWIYCILIMVAYRSSLTTILANPAPRVTIDTLEELANSPIACGVWGEQNQKFFLASNDSVSNKIGAKIELIKSADEAINRVSQGKFSYFENEYFLKEMRHKHDQIASNKLKYLHIMKECAINMPISIGLEKNSPLKPKFDQTLRQIIETGLISKWLSDSIQRFESSSEEPPQEALMDLKKLYGVLFAILFGFGIATLALISEILYWKFITKKSPLYDKYDIMKLYYH